MRAYSDNNCIYYFKLYIKVSHNMSVRPIHTGFTKLEKYNVKKYYDGRGIKNTTLKKYYDRSYDPKLTLTFRPGNYTRRFSYGFGVVVRDLGEWRPGFYSEFRYASREHSGLAWGAFPGKMTKFQEMTSF